MVALTQQERPDADKLVVKPDQLGLTPTWSYSALKVFEECPYRTYINRVKKIAEPSSPAATRGSEIHEQAEDYVKGVLGEMPETLKKFEDDFEELRKLYADAKVELEGNWGFDLNWQPTGWMTPKTWVRIKLDAFVYEDEHSARVIDYKTGQKWGNEIGHGQQCLLYAISTFFRYPDLQFAQTELWYLDKGETTKKQFTREEAMSFAPGFHRRGVAMTTCTDYEPRPSKNNCKWCPYKKGEYPECAWGVS